jgi:hypothetical protein
MSGHRSVAALACATGIVLDPIHRAQGHGPRPGLARGTVPIKRLALDELARFTTLEGFLSKYLDTSYFYRCHSGGFEARDDAKCYDISMDTSTGRRRTICDRLPASDC